MVIAAPVLSPLSSGPLIQGRLRRQLRRTPHILSTGLAEKHIWQLQPSVQEAEGAEMCTQDIHRGERVGALFWELGVLHTALLNGPVETKPDPSP